MVYTLISAKSGQKYCARNLKKGDEDALKGFNDSLSEDTRSKFLPHSYDDKTIEKVIERSENQTDVTIGLFSLDESKKIMIGYGFLWHAKQRIPLLGIGLTDSLKRLGLGKQLMAILEEHARSNGIFCFIYV